MEETIFANYLEALLKGVMNYAKFNGVKDVCDRIPEYQYHTDSLDIEGSYAAHLPTCETRYELALEHYKRASEIVGQVCTLWNTFKQVH